MRSARAEERARGCARGARVLTLGPTGGGFGGALGLSAFGAGFSALTATENLLRGTLRAAPARIIVVARICKVPKLLQAWLMGSVCWRVHVRTLLIHTLPPRLIARGIAQSPLLALKIQILSIPWAGGHGALLPCDASADCFHVEHEPVCLAAALPPMRPFVIRDDPTAPHRRRRRDWRSQPNERPDAHVRSVHDCRDQQHNNARVVIMIRSLIACIAMAMAATILAGSPCVVVARPHPHGRALQQAAGGPFAWLSDALCSLAPRETLAQYGMPWFLPDGAARDLCSTRLAGGTLGFSF